MVVYRFGNRPKRTIDKVIMIGSAALLYTIGVWGVVCAWRTDVGLGIFVSAIWFIGLGLLTVQAFDTIRGYIEIQNDTVHIVRYRFFVRREAHVSLLNVTHAKIVYDRWSGTKIHFKNKKNKTLFYVYATPQTKEFFAEYLNKNGIEQEIK